MNINLSISSAPSIVNKLAVCIFKASAENTLVDSHEFNPPHTSPRNITFTDVEAVSWIVNTYETTGLPSFGTLRHSFIYDPSFTQAEIKATEFLQMTAGQTGYTDESWVGWDIESIERVGQGTQFDGQEISIRSNGFDLLNDGDQFTDGEKWVVRFYPKISQATPVITTSKIFNGSEIIIDDTVIDESFNGKILLIQGSTSIVTLTLKPCAVIGAFQPIAIISNGGNHVTCRVIVEGNTDPFLFWGGEVDEIIIGQSEQLQLTTDTANGFIVMQASPTILQAGQFVDVYDLDNEPNIRHCAGQLVNRNIYMRLWRAVQNMDPSLLVSESVWNDTSGGQNNKGKFSTGDGSTTFRLPQIYAAGYTVAVDGTTKQPGAFQAWEMGQYEDVTGNAAGAAVISGLAYQSGGAPFRTRTVNSGKKNQVDRFGVYKAIRI